MFRRKNAYFSMALCALTFNMSGCASTSPLNSPESSIKASASPHKIYASLGKKNPSTFETNGWVFVVSSWKTNTKDSYAKRTLKELNSQGKALEEYFLQDIDCFSNSPFPKKINQLLPLYFPLQFPTVSGPIVSDIEKNGLRTQVFAFKAEEIRKKKAEFALSCSREKPKEEWESILKKVYTGFSEESKPLFFEYLECPLVNILLEIDLSVLLQKKPPASSADEEIKAFCDWINSPKSFFASHQGFTKKSKMKEADPFFYTDWREKDNGEFEAAKKLYQQGRDIDQITDLLVKSISINPIDSTKWCFLGGALNYKKLHYDALFAYLQAYKIDPSNQYVRKGISNALKGAGMHLNAAGMEWYWKVFDPDPKALSVTANK